MIRNKPEEAPGAEGKCPSAQMWDSMAEEDTVATIERERAQIQDRREEHYKPSGRGLVVNNRSTIDARQSILTRDRNAGTSKSSSWIGTPSSEADIPPQQAASVTIIRSDILYLTRFRTCGFAP